MKNNFQYKKQRKDEESVSDLPWKKRHGHRSYDHDVL